MKSTFEASPPPERIYECSFVPSGQTYGAVFSVGIKTRTLTHDGLKTVPTKEVAFAIGTRDAPEQKVFSVSPSFARGLADRLVDFANAIEDRA